MKPPNRNTESASPCKMDFPVISEICLGMINARITVAIQNRIETKSIGETMVRLCFTTVKVLPQMKVMATRATSAWSGLESFMERKNTGVRRQNSE